MIKQIGKQLREAREAKSLTLDHVSRDIRIRTRYLEALEEGNLGELPSAVHVRGFLRSYADFLGLNADDLLNALRQGAQPTQTETPATEANNEAPPQDAALLAEGIFNEIGSTIQSRRETLGLSLDDIEQYTHITPHYARMIENGEFGKFPSPVQARGMLSNYADFLEMDTRAVMLRYAEALQTRLTASQAVEEPKTRLPDMPTAHLPRLPQWLRNVLSPDTVVFGVIGVFIILFTIWGIGRILNTQASTGVQPTAPSLADALLPSSTPNPTATATFSVTLPAAPPDVGDVPPEDQTPTPTLFPIAQANIQIYIIVRQRTFMKVTTDGEVVFEGRVLPGTNLPYTGDQQIELLTGNAAALQVFYNDLDIGPLGIYGEVIDLVFTRDGVVRPTATPTPTLSLDQLATTTPTPTEMLDTPLPEETSTPPP